MSDSDIEQLRARYEEFQSRRQARRSAGQLRPSRGEIDALSAYESAMDALKPSAGTTSDTRSVWMAEKQKIDEKWNRGSCACGHHKAQHQLTGSCFHVIGCATECGCHQFRETEET